MSSGRAGDPAKLPLEVFLLVLRYLRMGDLANAVRVDKKWNHVGSEILWHDISSFKDWTSLKAPDHRLQLVRKVTLIFPSLPLPQTPRLTEISLKPQKDSLVNTFDQLQVYPDLRHLKILSGRLCFTRITSDVSLIRLKNLQELTIEIPYEYKSFEIPKLKKLTLRGDIGSMKHFLSCCKFVRTPQELVHSVRSGPFPKMDKERFQELISRINVGYNILAKRFSSDLDMIHVHLEDAVVEHPFSVTCSDDFAVSVTGGAKSLPSLDIRTVKELFFPPDHEASDNFRTKPDKWQSGPVPLPLLLPEPLPLPVIRPELAFPGTLRYDPEYALIEIQGLPDVTVDYQVLQNNHLAVRIFGPPLAGPEISEWLRYGPYVSDPLDLGPEVSFYNPARHPSLSMHKYDGVSYIREWTGVDTTPLPLN